MPPSVTTGARSPKRSSTIAEREAVARTKIRKVQQEAGVVGGLIEGQTLEPIRPTASPYVTFYVHGMPAAQGSKTNEGRIMSGSKSIPRLVEQNAIEPWRDEIRRVMKSILRHRPDWCAITDPVILHATFALAHTAASRARGDTWHVDTPDADKLLRALGDAISPKKAPPRIGAGMPEKQKARVRREYQQTQSRLCFLSDDKIIVGSYPLKMYAGSPGALRHPGVVCSIYPAPDLTTRTVSQ